MLLPNLCKLTLNTAPEPTGPSVPSQPSSSKETFDPSKGKKQNDPLHHELDRRWHEKKGDPGSPPDGVTPGTYPELYKLWRSFDRFREAGLKDPVSGQIKGAGWKKLSALGVVMVDGKEQDQIPDLDDPEKKVSVARAHKEFLEYKKQLKRELISAGKTITPNVADDTMAVKNNTYRTRAHALLRYWFNTDGRVWNHSLTETDKSHVLNQARHNKYVTKEYNDKRHKWAMAIIKSGTFDPNDNIPIPPFDLWIPGYDVYPSTTITSPQATFAITDEINADSLIAAMPTLMGPSRTLSNVGYDGAKAIVYVKRIEAFFHLKNINRSPGWINDHPSPFTVLETFPDTLNNQDEPLRLTYEVFMEALATMGVSFTKTYETVTNDVFAYTQTSSKYNFPLRYTATQWKPLMEATEQGGDRNAALNECVATINAQSANFKVDRPYLDSALQKIHGLWKLMCAAPRCPQDIYVFRSERSADFLPHALAGNDDPKSGNTFLLPSFTSTTVAPPKGYYGGTALASFYNKVTQCCIYCILVKKGTPILPAFMGSTQFPSEKEIILGPLTKLTYVGEKRMSIPGTGATNVNVTAYIAESVFKS